MDGRRTGLVAFYVPPMEHLLIRPSHCGGYELGWEVDPRDGSVAVGGRSWLDGGP